jgi:hypothetical protein
VSGDILDAIDGALSDWSVSKEAMRWNPEAGEVEGRCQNSADFSLAMLPSWQPTGHLALSYETAPFIASIQEGDVISVDGEPWRVTGVHDLRDCRTFDLEAYALPEPEAAGI